MDQAWLVVFVKPHPTVLIRAERWVWTDDMNRCETLARLYLRLDDTWELRELRRVDHLSPTPHG